MSDTPKRAAPSPWKLISGVLLFLILWSGFSGEKVYLTDGMAVYRRFSWWGFSSDEFLVGIKRSDDREPQNLPDDARWYYRDENRWVSFEVGPYYGDSTDDAPGW